MADNKTNENNQLEIVDNEENKSVITEPTKEGQATSATLISQTQKDEETKDEKTNVDLDDGKLNITMTS